MAEAAAGGRVAPATGSHGLRKALSWKDGLAVAMVMPAGAIASYGYWQTSLGTWAVMLLLGLSTLIAVLQVPARAMTVDLLINVFLVFLISNPVGIYATANLGYFVMIFFVLTGFLLLRRDRPDWPRPIRLGRSGFRWHWCWPP